jgi:hypothetical protein
MGQVAATELGCGAARRKRNVTLPKSIWILGIALAGLILLLAPVPAFAQSCALCYTQAASSGSRMIQALRSGILILVAPPTFMSIGMIFVCYRKRNQTRDNDGDESDRKSQSNRPSDHTPSQRTPSNDW